MRPGEVFGDKCKEEHREQHEEDCKTRAKKLHDDDLFTQPDETHLGECPICFLPMPLNGQAMFHSCCSKSICMGCIVAEIEMSSDIMKYLLKANRCAFCREPAGENEDESRSGLMKRIKANDPAAIREFGIKLYDEGDYDDALTYFMKAVELEDPEAHYRLGQMYHYGNGVKKDEEKEVYHFEKAAIGGHPEPRMHLGVIDVRNGRFERAKNHFIIAANLGHEESMKRLLPVYKHGYITKEEYEATLRTHQAAVDEMKSSERDYARKFLKNMNTHK